MEAAKRKSLSILSVLGMVMALLPAMAATAGAITGDMVITGVVDGPLTGGTPKAVELYVVNDIADLSMYGVGSANNGGGTNGEEFTFPAVAATAGDFIYVASEVPGFRAFFGFAPDYTSGAASINGDDAIELFKSGAVVDVFGDINVDGTGQPWEYLDGWAYRVDGTGWDGSTFVLANWTFSGIDALDGATTNATASTPFPIGTYQASAPPVDPTIQCGAPLVTEAGTAASRTITASDADDTIVAMSLVSGPSGLTAGTFTPSAGVGDAATLELDLAATAVPGSYSATVEATNSSSDSITCDLIIEVEPPIVGPTPIHVVQGAGSASPLDGQVVVVEGIVVGDFQDGSAGTNGDLNGFHVQEEDGDADADPATSEGIFVFDGSNPAVDVAVGDLVRVSGTVDEFFGLTEITSVTEVTVLSTDNPLPTPATASLPVGSVDDLEAFEGMRVTFPQPLVIAEYFNFDRFGEIVLTSQRNLTPTAEVEPGAAAAAEAAAYLLDRITLDDGRTNQNPDPAIHPNGGVFGLSNLFRGGDTVRNVTGVMDFSFNLYRIQPTQGADHVNANPRPAQPDDVGGRLEVATFNVLNYYTTLDQSGAACYPSNTRADCRGADNAGEFTRQRDKIISALAVMDADVVGLMEIENNEDVAVADLVAGLNEKVGAGTYDYVAAGRTGTDTIKVALIYQPDSVTPAGAHAVLDTPGFLDPAGTGIDRNRAALAQTFTENATGAAFTVVVNHFKSKSGSEIGASGAICVDGDPTNDIPDCDQGDGQGYFNHTRTLTAQVLADWLATDPTGSGDADVLIIGDLNSYDKETPIDTLKAAGYQDLVFTDLGEDAYSYVFDGQVGYLDYVMANTELASQVTGTTVWHINADEPDLIDYDTSFKGPNQDAIYAPDQYRSSDHDPVITGLDLATTRTEDLRNVLADLQALLPSGDRKDDKAIGKAIEAVEDSLDPSYWIDPNHPDPKRGHKVFDEVKKAIDELGKVKGDAKTDAQTAIGVLVGVGLTLANSAVDEAAAAGADTSKAEKELAKADDKSKPDQKMDRYREAWKKAIKALGDVEVRFATFNASLNRFNAGQLAAEVSAPGSTQPDVIAEIIQRARPDVILINEFDFDAGHVALNGFHDNYLMVPHGTAQPIEYPYRYAAPSNTGIPSGFDLDNNGGVGGPNDAFGFGFFPGQFGMAVYSKYPIAVSDVRTFQNFLWKDMPGALLPENPDGTAWYSPEELDVFRLSSKSHWDLPIVIGDETIHFLTSHPTPPVFDGPEDRNGTRNFDEIRFWSDYVTGGGTAKYIYDDNGTKGGLDGGATFVIAGDQNSDPFDGDSIPGAIQQLLNNPKVNDKSTPSSPGGPEQAALQGRANDTHISDPAFDTADFSDSSPGNLRADYVLPSKKLKITGSAVFWPLSSDPLFSLVGTFPFPSSDHRLVWVDVE